MKPLNRYLDTITKFFQHALVKAEMKLRPIGFCVLLESLKSTSIS